MLIHRFVASGCAGVALILGLFILEESNPYILEKRKMKKSGVVTSNQSKEGDGTTAVISEDREEQKEVKEVKVEADTNKKEKTSGTFHITQLMVICFIYEFCVRFAQGGYNSRYGIYVTRKFGITSDIFAYVFFTQLIQLIQCHHSLSMYCLIH